MKYQLTIKNTETGETLQDLNTDCVLLAAHTEESTAAMLISSCTAGALANVYRGATAVIKRLKAEHPEAVLLDKLASLAEEAKEDETNNEINKKGE